MAKEFLPWIVITPFTKLLIVENKTIHTEHDPQDENNKINLNDLMYNIKEAFIAQKGLTFRIVEPKEKGFSVKVGGLFAFVSYNHFAWSYPTFEYWKNVADKIVGCYFIGKIYKITNSPISILLDAKEQNFTIPTLKQSVYYKAVVLQKTNYGIFLDLGLHFHWKNGSIVGLIHNSNMSNPTDYNQWGGGDEVTTLFQGFNENGKLVLGDSWESGKWLNGEMDELVGTIQKVHVVTSGNGKTVFYVLGKHMGKLPMLHEFYPTSIPTIRQYIYRLQDGDLIDCEVIRINSKKDCFILRLKFDP